MSSLRDRLRAEAERYSPDGEAAFDSVVRRGRRRRIVRTAIASSGGLILVVGLAFAVPVTQRTQDTKPIDDPLGSEGRCGPALEYAKAYGRIDRWVAGETLTRRQWFEHLKKQAGPGGPYPGFDPSDPRLTEPITLCVYDGEFHVAKGAPGGDPPRYTRLSLQIRSDGMVDFDAVGSSDRLLPPAAWEAARHGRPLPSPSP